MSVIVWFAMQVDGKSCYQKKQVNFHSFLGLLPLKIGPLPYFSDNTHSAMLFSSEYTAELGHFHNYFGTRKKQ